MVIQNYCARFFYDGKAPYMIYTNQNLLHVSCMSCPEVVTPVADDLSFFNEKMCFLTLALLKYLLRPQ